MKSFGKVVLGMAVACLVSAIPASAQITDGLDFTTTFPFYVGNARMPAGSYKVTTSGVDQTILLIQNQNDDSHAAFIDFVPTEANTDHANSDVLFQKYGNADFLSRLWVGGQTYGMQVEPTKAEQKMAAASSAVEHSVAATKLPGKGETASVVSH